MRTKNLRLQDYLSIGYVYLLILGVAREAIFYAFMGVNIINYSIITDVLLSPLTYLVDHPTLFILIFVISYWVAMQPSFHRLNREKKWYQKYFDVDKRDAYYAKQRTIPGEIILLGIGVALFLLGTGLGEGLGLSRKLKAGELKTKDRIEFLDGEASEVRIIGQNSSYLFYVNLGGNTVIASPINGVIKRINRGSRD